MSPPFDARRDPVLVLHAVAKAYRVGVAGCAATVRVLVGVDLVVLRGERVLVTGARGSGKSTLLRVAAGLLAPDRGVVWRRGDVRMTCSRLDVARAPARGVARSRSDAVATVVAERARGSARVPPIEGLAWLDEAARGAWLAAADDVRGAPAAPTRVLVLDGGRLWDAPPQATGRVDSGSGAP